MEDPNDEYDRTHGARKPDNQPTGEPGLPSGGEFTIDVGNPVRDTPTPFKNLTGGNG
jgi:hypothetical protein